MNYQSSIAAFVLLAASGCTHVSWRDVPGSEGVGDNTSARFTEENGDYCAAEVLRWHYDVPERRLTVTDARLLLNCCGQREIVVERADSMVEIIETDRPSETHGRCSENCAFDLVAIVEGVAAGPTVVRLLRDVVDVQGSPELIWEGALSLPRVAAGAALLDGAHAGPACRDGHVTSPGDTPLLARTEP